MSLPIKSSPDPGLAVRGGHFPGMEKVHRTTWTGDPSMTSSWEALVGHGFKMATFVTDLGTEASSRGYGSPLPPLHHVLDSLLFYCFLIAYSWFYCIVTDCIVFNEKSRL